MKRSLILFLAFVAVAVVASAQHAAKDHGVFTPPQVQWMDAPSAIPPGAKIAVLEGNPFEPGLYTMRLQMPAGYRIPPHWHAKSEHVTVISGTFNLGMGQQFDTKSAMAMPAGTFGFLGPNMKHFAFASEPTVIQLHGEGPWGIYYVNDADDPRKAK